MDVIHQSIYAHRITPAAGNVVHDGIHMLIQRSTVHESPLTHCAIKWIIHTDGGCEVKAVLVVLV